MHILHICTCMRYRCSKMCTDINKWDSTLHTSRRDLSKKTLYTSWDYRHVTKGAYQTHSRNEKCWFTLNNRASSFFWKEDIIKSLHKKKASYSIERMRGYESLTRILASFDRRWVSMLCTCERHYTHVRGSHVSYMDGSMSIMSIWDTAVTCEISGTRQSCVYDMAVVWAAWGCSHVSGYRGLSCARHSCERHYELSQWCERH